VPPAMMVAPYAAAFLWIVFPTDLAASAFALGALHGLQYLACCHRATKTRPARPNAWQSLRWSPVLRWIEVFGGAACGGLLLTVWLPQLLNRAVAIPDAPVLFTAVFFVFLNLHHYLIDAVIWRSKGEIVRSMMSNGPAEVQAAPTHAPATI
jgi:hypothetical protein